MRSSCIACRRNAARKSPLASSTGRSPSSGTKPRTACMSRRPFSPGAWPDAMPLADDLVQPFQIEPFAVRGRLVRLGPLIDRILTQHAYPEPVAIMLGEAITLAVALSGALKYDGVFTLQTKGDGPIKMMVADV